MTTFSETTLPALIFSVPAGHPKGDVPALGRLTVNEAQAVDQWWVTYGLETNDDYTHTDSTGSGALFYEAESRTALGGSATAVGPSGASGGGSNVMRNTSLPVLYQGILSTQASGGGAHLTHVGTFRVYARAQAPTTNTGVVSVALEWSVGDFRKFTQNEAVVLDATWEGTWRLVDLGLVVIPKLVSGTQRWEGRILAKSTIAGDDIDIDHLFLVPVSEKSGIASGVFQVPSATTFSARDEFDQAAGVLAGKTAAVGGVWAGAGDTDDFSVETTGKTAQRTAVSDADKNTGRYALSGVSAFTTQVVQVDVKRNATFTSGSELYCGPIARYVDTNNWLMAHINNFSGAADVSLEVRKRVAGTVTTLATVTLAVAQQATYWLNKYFSVRLMVDAGGRWYAWLNQSAPLAGSGGSGINPSDVDPGVYVLLASGSDADLGTGGALASGKPGFYDAKLGAEAVTRNFDNFAAWAPVSDAALFASQSLEVRHDGVIREDSTGSIWQPVSSYTGDLHRVPVTGREGRSIRYIVKACRNDPATGPDSGIDDINATLAVTPRYLSVPAPA